MGCFTTKFFIFAITLFNICKHRAGKINLFPVPYVSDDLCFKRIFASRIVYITAGVCADGKRKQHNCAQYYRT